MDGITERDIQDFLAKTENFLPELPLEARQKFRDQWSEKLRRYLEARGAKGFEKLKRDLGGPRGLANVVRIDHQLPLHRKNGSERTFFAVFAALLLSFAGATVFLLWKFSPLLQISEDRVKILGGLVDIDGQMGQLKVGDSFEFTDSQFKNVFEGSYDIAEGGVEDLVIEFDRGQLELLYTQESKLVWTCKVASEPSEGFIKHEKELVTMGLKDIGGADCSLKLPSKLKHTITGDMGKIDVIAPANDTFIQLGSGLVSVAPDPEYNYRLDLKVGTGTISSALQSLSQDEGIEIKVELGTGSIQKK